MNLFKIPNNEICEIEVIPAQDVIVAYQIAKIIEDEKIDIQLAKLQSPISVSKFPPIKDLIEFEDFTKMDIRVGKILTAEKVEKADKLLKLTIDTGLDTRTVVSGIAEDYDPTAIIGHKVTLLMNLAPRKIRGIESKGMILMAENASGELSFMSPEKAFEAGCGIH